MLPGSWLLLYNKNSYQKTGKAFSCHVSGSAGFNLLTYMMRHYFSLCILILTVLFFPSCAGYKVYYSNEAARWKADVPPDSSNLAYSVYLIGDVGAPNRDPLEPSLKLLQSQMQVADENSATIFLGDNIYSYGLTEPGSIGRKTDEERINTQLDLFKN
ncbi:MAG: hypothetical protein COW65_08040, partial [Cytophagales bacterium CG18_big_fil_WC_8_21_14_2_50_42_9]